MRDIRYNNTCHSCHKKIIVGINVYVNELSDVSPDSPKAG